MKFARIIACVFATFMDVSGFAQGILSGSVYDASDGSAINGATVSVKRGAGAVTDFSISDANGRFLISCKESVAAGDTLVVAMLGYASVKVALPCESPLEIRLTESAIKIKESLVRAPKIRMMGDTLKYNVQSFLDDEDVSLEDVLRRMPGIEIDENGAVMYNGKSLGNMYVEGMDIVGGRYNLLTKNIPAKDVQSVEVVEFHQPIKALARMQRGETPMINLRLSKSAKVKLIGEAVIGGGVSSKPEALWVEKLALSRISRKWSSINVLKSNNAGDVLSGELTLGTENNWHDYISITPSEAPLSSNRTFLGKEALVSTSNTWKMSNDWEARLQASAYFGNNVPLNKSTTTYYLGDTTRSIVEEQATKVYDRTYQVDLEVKNNGEASYVGNRLSLAIENDDVGQAVAGSSILNQSNGADRVAIGDDFKYIMRTSRRRTLQLASSNDFICSKEELSVENGQASLAQTVKYKEFNTDSNMGSLVRLKGGLSLNMRLGMLFSSLKMDGDLLLDGDGSRSLDCMNLSLFQPYLYAMVSKISNRWEFNCGFPTIGWAWYGGLGQDTPAGRLSSTVMYKASAKLSFTAMATVGKSPKSLDEMHDWAIMKDYRNIFTGTSGCETGLSGLGGLRMDYKEAPSMLFLSAQLRASKTSYKWVTSRKFIGDYVLYGQQKADASSDSWSASMDFNKGFYGTNSKVEAKFSYGEVMSDAMFQDGARSPYRSRLFAAHASYSGRFADWMSFGYAIDYSHSIFSYDTASYHISRDKVKQSLYMTISPLKGLDMKLSATHYCNTLSDGKMKNAILADASASYMFNRSVKLILSATNLVGDGTYAYSSFDGTVEYSCDYAIRPLNVIASLSFSF